VSEEITIASIRDAAQQIAGRVTRTPTLPYALSDECTLFCKAECLQPIGAFKIRGAFNMMSRLEPGGAGVVAHSSGNHAQAVARAARLLGISAVIVMPSDAPPLKRMRVELDGADVVTVGPDSEERRIRADEIVAETGRVLVPPYDHALIASGAGTSALELLQDAGELDRFYAPCSGGGLMAGCATAVSALNPGAEIVGVEPADANDTKLSLEAGERVAVPPPTTIADGLRVRRPGAVTWPVIQRLVSRVELVSDEELLQAMAWAFLNLRVVLEPSGAASLALAMREGRGRCGVLLSGGNVDPSLFDEIVARARAML